MLLICLRRPSILKLHVEAMIGIKRKCHFLINSVDSITGEGASFNSVRAIWVRCFVGSSTVSTFDRWMGASRSGLASVKFARMVLCCVCITANGTGWMFLFTQWGRMPINLAFGTLRPWPIWVVS
jgi:hypothetical protein